MLAAQPSGIAANRQNQYDRGWTVAMKFGKPIRADAGAPS